MKINNLIYIVFYLVTLSCSTDDATDVVLPDIGEQETNGLYFPPSNSDVWRDTSTVDLGLDETALSELRTFHEENATDAFIVLKDGKIVIEEYYNGFEADSQTVWNSASKSYMALAVGIAQEKKLLDIDDSSSIYLGKEWTSLTPGQEGKITIRNQLTMTSGLDESGNFLQFLCYSPSCLKYEADASTRWAYHNGPYTRLYNVIEDASGQDFNEFSQEYIGDKIGFSGTWKQGLSANTLTSDARDMARFGLLILNNGDWGSNPVINDKNYFEDMLSSSQDLNESYGYLWWLNGQSSHMVPSVRTVFSGAMNPNAPDDMVSALGLDGQIIDIISSQNLVVIRKGNSPNDELTAATFSLEMWKYIKELGF